MRSNNFSISKFNWYIFFAIYLWLSSAICASVSVKTQSDHLNKSIRFTISESWSEPYIILDKDLKIIGGLMPDLINALANKLNGHAEFVQLSRKRLDVVTEEAAFDIRCFTRENWTTDPKIFHWSKNIFTIVNQIVWKDSKLAIKDLSEIKSKTVGTILGYNYKGLDPYFASGKLIRSDVKSESINFDFLEAGRVDYAIFESVNLDWTLKNKKSSEKINLGRLNFDVLPVKCALLKTSPVSITDLNHAITSLEKEGFFEHLFLKYGLKENQHD